MRATAHTIANTIKMSSQLKAFTSLNRTKHRNAIPINEMQKNITVTTKIVLLRPSNSIFVCFKKNIALIKCHVMRNMQMLFRKWIEGAVELIPYPPVKC